jgi:NADH-quinone oxidoreductase subunit M
MGPFDWISLHLRLDGLSGPIALLLALRAVAVLVGSPRSARSSTVLARELITLALSLGACAAQTPVAAVGLGLAAAVAGWHPLAMPWLVAHLPLMTLLLIRFVGPAVPHLPPAAQATLAAAGVTLSLYGALSALAQTNLRRLVRALAISHVGLILGGISTGTVHAYVGASVECLSSGLTLSGMAMIVASIGARTGTVDVRALGGLVRGCGRMTAVFLLLGVASVGFPATLAFVGEDLLLHGLIDAHPLLAAAMLFSTALGGIAMFRGWQRAFLGPSLDMWRRVPDLLARERLALFGIVAAVLLTGIFPTHLVQSESDAVGRILHAVPTYEGAP